MKNIYILISIFAFSYCFSQVKNSKNAIFYEYTFRKDSTEISKSAKELMVLLISDNNSSLYTSYSKIKKDSIIKSNFAKGLYEINYTNFPRSSVSHEVFKEAGKDSLLVFDKIGPKGYVFEEKNIKWTIGKQKKNISNFDCQNAFCNIAGREYTAWFSTKLLPGEGPYRFKGLPGLILQVEDKDKNFEINFVGSKNISLPLNISTKSLKTNRKDFIKARNEFQADPIGKGMMDYSRLSTMSEEQKKRIKENIKKNNLFIEQK